MLLGKNLSQGQRLMHKTWESCGGTPREWNKKQLIAKTVEDRWPHVTRNDQIACWQTELSHSKLWRKSPEVFGDLRANSRLLWQAAAGQRQECQPKTPWFDPAFEIGSNLFIRFHCSNRSSSFFGYCFPVVECFGQVPATSNGCVLVALLEHWQSLFSTRQRCSCCRGPLNQQYRTRRWRKFQR